MLYFKNLLSAAGVPLLAASALTLSALSGCQKSPERQPPDAASAAKTTQTRAAAAPEANVFVDEPLLAKPYAVIGGAVENVGARRLENLSVEIELRRRADGGAERREVAVEPASLEPGQRGKFSLKVLSDEWGNSRVVKLRGGARPDEVAFKSLPGAKWPPERLKPNVVVVKTPTQKKSDGSDFINTPDTPYKVP